MASPWLAHIIDDKQGGASFDAGPVPRTSRRDEKVPRTDLAGPMLGVHADNSFECRTIRQWVTVISRLFAVILATSPASEKMGC